jgi:hypothetical protein
MPPPTPLEVAGPGEDFPKLMGLEIRLLEEMLHGNPLI